MAAFPVAHGGPEACCDEDIVVMACSLLLPESCCQSLHTCARIDRSYAEVLLPVHPAPMQLKLSYLHTNAEARYLDQR